jgi:hypothetical protein
MYPLPSHFSEHMEYIQEYIAVLVLYYYKYQQNSDRRSSHGGAHTQSAVLPMTMAIRSIAEQRTIAEEEKQEELLVAPRLVGGQPTPATIMVIRAQDHPG